jgi:hypothetical protein
MANLVVFVESGCPSGTGCRDNMYFEKGVTYPSCAGRACDISVLTDKLSEKVPGMLIINSRISIQKKDGFLAIEEIIRTVSAHNWKYRTNPVRKLIFNRCEDVGAINAKLESMVSMIGTEIDVALTNIDEPLITDVFTAQQNEFFVDPDRPLKSIIDVGVSRYDLGYYGYSPDFVYSTIKL